MTDLVSYKRPPRPDPLDLDAAPADRPRSATEFAGVREYLAMVRRHWWLVLLVLIASVAYTANKAMKERPMYRAASTVRLVDSRRAVGGDVTGRNAMDGIYGFQSDPIESQIQVLQSGAVADVAVDLKGLRLIPVPGTAWIDEISAVDVSDSATASVISMRFDRSGFAAASDRSQRQAPYGQALELDGVVVRVDRRPPVDTAVFRVVSREAAIANASKGFSVTLRPRTDILDLSYTGSEPWHVKRMTNAMAEAFKVHNALRNSDMARRRRQFLETQLRQTDSILREAQARYSAFRSGRQVHSSTQQAGAEQAGLIDIDRRRAELDAEKTTYVDLLSAARRSEGNSTALRTLASSPGIASNPVVQQFYTQLEAYQRSRDSLMNAGAARTNPDVIAITSLIPAAASKMMDAVQSQILSLDAQVAALERLRRAGATRIAQSPDAETQELELQSEVQTVQLLARQLQDEHQRARMAEAIEGGQVEIVQLATSRGSQIATGKRRKVMMGATAGLLLGCIAAILLDGLNASIRKRSDIERLLGVPSLAVIPRLPSRTGRGQKMLRALPRMGTNGRPRPGLPDADLVTVRNVRSPAAESFRTLRTNLMFSQSVAAMRTLVVTSASPSEGKTTTASNLAVSFAQQGMRVLLVDCDLRRSRIHRIFGLQREPGFTDLTLGYASEEEVTHPTSVTGLYVIASGKLPPNPAELLGSDTTRRLFDRLTEGYDLIIVDTPPLLAASDAAILATVANGVVLVLRAGATENAAAQQAVQQLGSVGARIVGAVLNDPDAQVPKYGAYYHYEYAGSEA